MAPAPSRHSHHSSSGRHAQRHRRRVQPLNANTLETALLYGFVALLVALPLLFGTTPSHPMLLAGAQFAILLLFGLSVVFMLGMGQKVQIPGLWLLLLGAGIYFLFQLLPLPSGLLAFLSPETDRLYRLSLSGEGLYPGATWMPISLDPAQTWLTVSSAFTLLMVFLMAANLFSRDLRMDRILRALAFSAFVVALLGVAQKSLGLTKIYHLEAFPGEVPFFFSSFVNPRHMAAFLALGLPIQGSVILKSRAGKPRNRWIAAFIVTLAALIASRSLAGIVGAFSGLLLLGYLAWRRMGRPGSVELSAVVSVSLLAIAAVIFVSTQFMAGSGSHGYSRLDLWQSALTVAEAFPLTGVGGGAFGAVHPYYLSGLPPMTYSEPENQILSLCISYGIPMGILLIVAVLFGFFLIPRSTHLKRLEMGGFSGLVALALSQTSGFALKSAAVAVSATTVLAILTVRAAEHPRNERFKPLTLPRWAVLAFFGFAALMVFVGQFMWQNHRVEASQTRLHAAVYSPSTSQAEFETLRKREFLSHPMDAYLRVLASERYRLGIRSELPYKVQYLEKAAALAPSDSQPPRRLGLAYSAVRDRDQARAAYRRALANLDPRTQREDFWNEMLNAGLLADDVVEVEKDGGFVLRLARFLENRHELEHARDLLVAASRRGPDQAPEAFFLLGQLELQKGRPEEAMRFAEDLLSDFPLLHYGRQLQGDVAMAQGRVQDALTAYAQAQRIKPVDLSLWHATARALLKAGQTGEAEVLARNLHGLSAKHSGWNARAFELSGDLAEARRDTKEARREYHRVLEIEPKNGEIHFKIGKTWEQEHDPNRAAASYRKALSLGADAGLVEAALTRLGNPGVEAQDSPQNGTEP